MTISYFIFLGLFLSCGSKSNDPRSREIRKTAEEESPDSPKADPKSDGGDENPTSDPKPTPQVFDESKLAEYILKKKDLEGLEPLVEPRVSAAVSGGLALKSARNSQEFANFVADVANRSMKLSALKPGRQFKATVIADNSLNALMTLDYQIGMHTGTITKGSADEVLSVVCHEVAHGARNHAYKSVKKSRELIPTEINRQIDQYMARQYNLNTKVYTHRSSTYLSLRDKWDQSTPEISTYYKRQEAEADVVGAKICAYMGLSPDQFSKKIVSFLQKGSTKDRPSTQRIRSARDLKEGDQLQIPEDVVMDFFFPIDSHPTVDERKEQINRLKGELSVNEEGIDGSLYSSWSENFDKKRNTLSNSGLSLVGTSPKESGGIVFTDLSTGQEVVIEKGPSCHHPLHLHQEQNFP